MLFGVQLLAQHLFSRVVTDHHAIVKHGVTVVPQVKDMVDIDRSRDSIAKIVASGPSDVGPSIPPEALIPAGEMAETVSAVTKKFNLPGQIAAAHSLDN